MHTNAQVLRNIAYSATYWQWKIWTDLHYLDIDRENIQTNMHVHTRAHTHTHTQTHTQVGICDTYRYGILFSKQ